MAPLLLLAGTAANAQTRVGVTSATDGDPLGKPPSANERILRIGIDVQANEVVTTRAADRAHLVFLDGTSLTVGPNAQLTIDRFVYDPSTRTGELAVTATRGVFRMVGGRITKSAPAVITTPSSTIGVRGGITVVDVGPNQTASTFVFGTSMTVTGQGQTQEATRPGSQIVTSFGMPPGVPFLIQPGALAALMAQLEGIANAARARQASAASAEQSSQSSGFTNTNSDQPVQVLGLKDGKPLHVGEIPELQNTIASSILSTANTQVDTQSLLASVSQQTSVATYVGTITGTAWTGSPTNTYAATGTYQNVWSFGAGSGVVTATYDNVQYGGGSSPNVTAYGNTPYFMGELLAPQNPNNQMNISGSFGSGNQTQSGSVTIIGTGYGGNGTFNATKQ